MQYPSSSDFILEKNGESLTIRLGVECGSHTNWLSFTSGVHFPGEERFSNVTLDFNIGFLPNWRVVLDEALRLLSKNGEFNFILTPSKYVSKYDFFKVLILACNVHKIRYSLKDISWEARGQKYVISYTKDFERDISKKWSFGILVNEEQNDNLIKFVKSVNLAFSNAPGEAEIIINGLQESRELQEISQVPITYIKKNYPLDKHYAPISHKKNDIAKLAKFPNLAIFHNRYSIAKDWRNIFDSYGYDFSILSGKQMYKGQPFPSWVALGTYRHYSKGCILAADEFHPNLYVNGGLIICKKNVLMECPFNTFLYWNECEDVEWSRRLLEKGYTPRYVDKQLAEVLSAREGYMDGFCKRYPFIEKVLGYTFCVSNYNPIKRRLLGMARKLLG